MLSTSLRLQTIFQSMVTKLLRLMTLEGIHSILAHNEIYDWNKIFEFICNLLTRETRLLDNNHWKNIILRLIFDYKNLGR